MLISRKLLILSLLLISGSGAICEHSDIVVDPSGNGDFKTITEAVYALPMYPYQRTIIFIKKGVYEEKLRIDQHYITLRGESRDSTIIRYNQPREAWNKNRDFLGPAVINLHGDDVVLDNLTIENTMPEIGPHAFAVYGTGTRTIITNCNVISNGGDTVSLWNYKHGMYYHANCFFQGAVDFVCPRGWCFIRDSRFYEVKATAALWHAAVYDPDQKFVIRNSDFDGVEGFQLGRHHYEAQFYMLDCRFSENMADRPIYHATSDNPAKNNPYFGGDRKYFYNCRKVNGKQFDWYRDNLGNAPGSPSADELTPAWTFNGKWDPESSEPVKVVGYEIDGKNLILIFNQRVTIRGQPLFTNASGKTFRLVMRRFNDIKKFEFAAGEPISESDLAGELTLHNGDIIISTASVHERSIGKTFQIQWEK